MGIENQNEKLQALTQRNRRNSYYGLDPRIIKIVRWSVSIIIGKLGFREHDRADLEQELMVALHLGLVNHDPKAGKITTFARCIVNRTMQNIIKSRLAPNGYHYRCQVSLNEDFLLDDDESGMELIDLVDSDGLLRTSCCNVTDTPADKVGMQMQIDLLFSDLSPELQSICQSMTQDVQRETSDKLQVPRYHIEKLQSKLFDKLKEREISLKDVSIP